LRLLRRTTLLKLNAPDGEPGRETMLSKSALVVTTAAALALVSFDLRPAAAAPQSGPAIAKQNAGADEFSSARKRRRGVHPAVPLAAFGAIAGTIAGIAAAERRRDYYERPHYGYYGYYEAPAYAPYAYQGFGPPLAPGPAYPRWGGHYQHAPQIGQPPSAAFDRPGY
jgi:hypothetical protein